MNLQELTSGILDFRPFEFASDFGFGEFELESAIGSCRSAGAFRVSIGEGYKHGAPLALWLPHCRLSPQAKSGATNVIVFMKSTP